MSERASAAECASARAKPVVRSKRTSERCERTSEWPSTPVDILGCSSPQYLDVDGNVHEQVVGVEVAVALRALDLRTMIAAENLVDQCRLFAELVQLLRRVSCVGKGMKANDT